MKFGAYLINPPNLPYAAGGRSTEEIGGEAASVTTPGYLRDCARYAEDLGFDSIWFPDHVVIPTAYSSRYPYQEYEGGEYRRYPFDETAFPEPMTALAYVAGATDRIKLRTGVLILPERNPVLFAKELGTLDALSGGRLELGIGIGWLREEFEALGISWPNRGRRCDEYIEAMREIWNNEVASYDGEFVSFSGDPLRPQARAARRRAADRRRPHGGGGPTRRDATATATCRSATTTPATASSSWMRCARPPSRPAEIPTRSSSRPAARRTRTTSNSSPGRASITSSSRPTSRRFEAVKGRPAADRRGHHPEVPLARTFRLGGAAGDGRRSHRGPRALAGLARADARDGRVRPT